MATGASILKLASEGYLDIDAPMAPLVDAYLARLAARSDWNETWSSLGDL